MGESQHWIDLLQCLNGAGAEYLIVGGFAVMLYAEPRFTKDLDIWINPTPANSERVFHALAEFGAPLEVNGITPGTFSEKDIVYQIGVTTSRIDILTSVSGIQFADAWSRRVEDKLFGAPAHFISLEDLITNKVASGRADDIDDLKRMRKKR